MNELKLLSDLDPHLMLSQVNQFSTMDEWNVMEYLLSSKALSSICCSKLTHNSIHPSIHLSDVFEQMLTRSRSQKQVSRNHTMIIQSTYIRKVKTKHLKASCEVLCNSNWFAFCSFLAFLAQQIKYLLDCFVSLRRRRCRCRRLPSFRESMEWGWNLCLFRYDFHQQCLCLACLHLHFLCRLLIGDNERRKILRK